MSLGKQAKHLSKGQIEAVLGYLAKTRHPIRNRLILFLSIKAGLRAREITHQGLYAKGAEGIPDRDGYYHSFQEDGDDLFDLLAEADWFRQLVREKANPQRVAKLVELYEGRINYTARIVPDRRRGMRIILYPNDLLELLRLQLLHSMTGSKSFVPCLMCGDFFERGVGTKRRGDAVFCSDSHRIEFNSKRRGNNSPVLGKVKRS